MSEQAKPMTDAEFVNAAGARCPYCRGSNVEYGESTVNGDGIIMERCCVDCGEDWSDVYALAGYQGRKDVCLYTCAFCAHTERDPGGVGEDRACPKGCIPTAYMAVEML